MRSTNLKQVRTKSTIHNPTFFGWMVVLLHQTAMPSAMISGFETLQTLANFLVCVLHIRAFYQLDRRMTNWWLSPNRNFESESERQTGVQEFYRLNHINQTYAYVSSALSLLMSPLVISVLVTFSTKNTLLVSPLIKTNFAGWKYAHEKKLLYTSLSSLSLLRILNILGSADSLNIFGSHRYGWMIPRYSGSTQWI